MSDGNQTNVPESVKDAFSWIGTIKSSFNKIFLCLFKSKIWFLIFSLKFNFTLSIPIFCKYDKISIIFSFRNFKFWKFSKFSLFKILTF